MKALIIYDSVFGNTEKIAQAMYSALNGGENTSVLHIGNVQPENLTGLQLLIVGSPTRGFRPTKPITTFLQELPSDGLKGIKVAAFDTISKSIPRL